MVTAPAQPEDSAPEPRRRQPNGRGLDAAEVAKLDVDALRRDVEEMMTNSRKWWPAVPARNYTRRVTNR